MPNLEDVFLQLNSKSIPDLFGDDLRRISDFGIESTLEDQYNRLSK